MTFRRTEPALAALAIVAFWMILLAAANGRMLFSRPLWLDEVLTYLVANDPSFFHAMAAVRHGVDANPPGLHATLWAIAKLGGGIGPVGLRTFALASVMLAMLGVYCTARRLGAGPPAALAGAAAMAAHPLAVEQAFEARYYGPLLAILAWFACAQLRARTTRRPRLAFAALALLAGAAGLVHYFGFLAVGLMLAADCWSDDQPLRARCPRLAGPLAGLLVAGIAALPFFLSQRAGLSVKTWVEPVNLAAVIGAWRGLVAPASVVAVLGIAAFGFALRGRSRVPCEAASGSVTPGRAMLPAASLLLFPLVIYGFSALVQPSFIGRYLMPTLVPLGVGCAVALEAGATGGLGLKPRGRPLVVALVITLLGLLAAGWMGGLELLNRRGIAVGDNAVFAETRRTAALAADSSPAGRPVVFLRRFDLYPLLASDPALFARCALLDFEDDPRKLLPPGSRIERDLGRKVAAMYPSRFRLVTLDSLRRAEGYFFVLAPPNRKVVLRRLFKGFGVREKSAWLRQYSPAAWVMACRDTAPR